MGRSKTYSGLVCIPAQALCSTYKNLSNCSKKWANSDIFGNNKPASKKGNIFEDCCFLSQVFLFHSDIINS